MKALQEGSAKRPDLLARASIAGAHRSGQVNRNSLKGYRECALARIYPRSAVLVRPSAKTRLPFLSAFRLAPRVDGHGYGFARRSGTPCVLQYNKHGPLWARGRLGARPC